MNIHGHAFVQNSDSASWHTLLERRDAAKHAAKIHDAMIWAPLAAKLESIVPRPDLHFEIEALSGQVARYNVPANDLNRWDTHWSPVVRHKAAAVRKTWLAYRHQHELLGLDTASAECDRLCEVQCDLEDRLLTTPAPDRAALQWKLEHLCGEEAMGDDAFAPAWCARWINVLMEDVRRLLRSFGSS